MQCLNALFEMEHLPERNAKIQDTETSHGTANPSRSNDCLQALSRFPRCIKQKVVVSPVAQSERALRNPGEQGQHYANFKTEDYVENYAELG